jgi:thioredoxin-dependent peroxiredoxin
MRFLPLAAAFSLLAAPLAADAALKVGAKAPDFRTKGALGGKQFDLTLSQQLKKGPVVLYFFPAAFTPGCTMEANAFAEATADFNKAGATIIGMSADPIDKLADFSVKECRSKFAVAAASPTVVKAYDVAIKPTADMPPKVQEMLAGKTSRTSYVIAPDGQVIYAFDNLDYRDHVKNTLDAVKKWKASRG